MDAHFALIEFKTVDDAAAVLSSNEIFIKVKAADPWLQPDHILNALNDDCLQAIFLQLNQSDLLNVSKVCVKFNQHAKAAFSRKYKKFRLSTDSYNSTKSLLQTFGSVIQSVDVHSDVHSFFYGDFAMKRAFQIDLLRTIAGYCNSVFKDTLQELRIHSMSVIIDADTVKPIAQMNGLKVLEFCDTFGLTNERIFKLVKGLGSHLETLKLNDSTAEHGLTINELKMMLPFATKLSHLSLKSTRIRIVADDYRTILETVRKRPEQIRLVLELFGKGGQVQIPEAILMGNRDVFDIDEKIHSNFIRRNEPHMLQLEYV